LPATPAPTIVGAVFFRLHDLKEQSMSTLNIHSDRPDVGVLFTDLFIYEMNNLGTGGAVSIVNPPKLLERDTVFIETKDLKLTFALNRKENQAELCLGKGQPAQETSRKRFNLAPNFQTEAQVVLNILYHDWKITALINGEPLAEVKQA
jgi:hypothetical protein